jgi:outer membrane protein TolC
LRDAEQTVASQEAAQELLVQARTQARNALAALLDRQVYDGPELASLPSATLPEVDAGVPSQLLARRPDLAAAELRLRGTLATADATRASYYPNIALTGALGTSSASLLRFLSNPVASLGAGLTQSVLNPGRIGLAAGVAQADVDIADATFRQTFYDALRDTDNALTARTQYLRQGEALQRNFDAAVDAELLYERQYRAGAITLRAWLDAQERRRTAQSSLSENRLNRLNAQVALYQALGGDVGVAAR